MGTSAPCRIFMILVDGDITCAPYVSLDEERAGLHVRAQALAAELSIVIEVCWARVEFESWLIGGIERSATYCSLQRVRALPANTENQPVDPKAWLRTSLRDSYEPRITECLAQRIDIDAARRRNRSLTNFLDAVAELAARR